MISRIRRIRLMFWLWNLIADNFFQFALGWAFGCLWFSQILVSTLMHLDKITICGGS